MTLAETNHQRLTRRIRERIDELRRIIHGISIMDVIDTSGLTAVATSLDALTTQFEAEPTAAAQLAGDQDAFNTALGTVQTSLKALQDVVNPPPPPPAAPPLDLPAPVDPAPADPPPQG